jgi:hypothetical protein
VGKRHRTSFHARGIGESLESRICLTSFGFVSHKIHDVELSGPTAQLVDVDTDGDLDVLATGTGKIAWYPSIGGGSALAMA